MKKLKKIDIFAQPMFTFSTNRNKKTNKKSFVMYHGSIFGGILTLVFAAITIGYIYHELLEMIRGNRDNTNYEIITNSMSGDSNNPNEEFIKNNSFFPSF